jgi:hypothetical protein
VPAYFFFWYSGGSTERTEMKHKDQKPDGGRSGVKKHGRRNFCPFCRAFFCRKETIRVLRLQL